MGVLHDPPVDLLLVVLVLQLDTVWVAHGRLGEGDVASSVG